MFLLALMQRSLARVLGVFLGLSLLLVGLQVLLVLVASAQEEAQSFDLLIKLAPGFVQRQMGSTLSAFMSFSGLVTFGYFHPVVVLTVALFAAFIASELATDVEGGQVDLLLSRPLARHWLVTRSLLLVMATPLVLVLLMLAASRAALGWFAPAGAQWPSGGVMATIAGHLVVIAWCFGTFALAAAAVAKRRVSALGPAAIVAVSFYLIEILHGAWRPLTPVAALSPFHYYQGAAIIAGTANSLRDFAVLGSMSLVSSAVAYWRFSARDL